MEFFHIIRAASAIPGGSVAFEADLASPSLAFLKDCRVAAGPGLPARCMLPHAALIEAAAEAVYALADSPAEQPVVLVRMAMQAPEDLAVDSRLVCTVERNIARCVAQQQRQDAAALPACQSSAPCSGATASGATPSDGSCHGITAGSHS